MGGDPGEPAAGNEARFDRLRAELNLVRMEGLPQVRRLAIPYLEEAAAQLGLLDDERPLREGIEGLLRAAVDRLGESRESAAASTTFGLAPGTKLHSATDRRRAASRALSVTTEHFRKHYEPRLIAVVAEETLTLLSFAAAASAADAPPSAEAVADGTDGVPLFAAEQQVSTIMRQARGIADWDLVEGMYRQCVDIAEDPHGTSIPRDVAGFLAEAFGRISANYHARENELVCHALGILGNIDRADTISPELFRRLYHDRRFDRFARYLADGAPLRRPRPFEALVETARRYRDLTTFQRVLARVPTAGILGGSLNYGRFFTVRGMCGRQPGSDVDVLVVLPDFDHLDAAVAGIAQIAAASHADVAALAKRAEVFTARGFDDGRTVFSHRIGMWVDRPDLAMSWAPNPGEYRMELTFASLTALDWLLVADATKLTADSAGRGRSVREYRAPGSDPDHHQRSFSGRNLRVPQVAEPTERGEFGFSRAYTIADDGDRYYPGVLQNVVLPRMTRRWGSEGQVPIKGRLEAFRWKVIERLRFERRLRPYEMLRLSLSHTRWEMFAPHVLRAVDSNDNTA